MAVLVLIPDDWHGGWASADFVAHLKREDHEAYPVMLRAARQAGSILKTHIADPIECSRSKSSWK
jgi:hypothetical protein